MKRLVLFLLLAVATAAIPAGASPSPAQESSKEASEPAEGEHEGLAVWKWANFALLCLAIGWVLKKNAGPFFAGRSRQIRKDMLEADDARQQAEARAAEIDRRLAGLETEIASLRAESVREAESETARLSRFTTAEIEKIQAVAEREIAAAGKAARAELKRYSAELAVRLAAEQLRAGMTPQTQDALVRGFVRQLEPSTPPGDSVRTS
jgi:F0F1-type ATP synthase membrane subunit b/b'